MLFSVRIDAPPGSTGFRGSEKSTKCRIRLCDEHESHYQNYWVPSIIVADTRLSG